MKKKTHQNGVPFGFLMRSCFHLKTLLAHQRVPHPSRNDYHALHPLTQESQSPPFGLTGALKPVSFLLNFLRRRTKRNNRTESSCGHSREEMATQKAFHQHISSLPWGLPPVPILVPAASNSRPAPSGVTGPTPGDHTLRNRPALSHSSRLFSPHG